MQFKKNFLIIPLVTVLVALGGSYFNMLGMEWYNQVLIKPEITPPRWLFPIAWNLIFLCATISALLTLNSNALKRRFLWVFFDNKPSPRYYWIAGLFLLNAFLNVFWSYLFFTLQFLRLAFLESFLLFGSTVALIVLIYPISKRAALLLAPYALWLIFAIYLTWQILLLNSSTF